MITLLWKKRSYKIRLLNQMLINNNKLHNNKLQINSSIISKINNNSHNLMLDTILEFHMGQLYKKTNNKIIDIF